MRATEEKERIVVKFAGDSGDGMQLVGSQFTTNTALIGNDLGTFPDFPAEIRAPQGTLPGVSGFQIHFGSTEIFTPGDSYDVLVAMNAAALKANLSNVREGGILILNTSGFDGKNLRLSGYEQNPLETDELKGHELYQIDVTKLTREALKEIDLGMRDKDRSKNMFVLGFIYWLFDRDPANTIKFVENKFAKNPSVLEANKKALKAGYNYGEISEAFSTKFRVKPAVMEPGTYRSINGNPALALGLIAAAQKAQMQLFYGTYPITPASDILHELARFKQFDVKTYQAEDEIAAVCASIGASYGGNLGVTGTSGPGLALKGEALGLAVMLELPLVAINIQRAGPSTGMPTKTEQADLMQSVYGRNGESPMPILAASTPSSCFKMAFEAARIAIEHMTPVILLSDGFIANGAEPWKFPKSSDLGDINGNILEPRQNGKTFYPYERDERLVRNFAVPGTPGMEHRIGGLEKEDLTGNVSYDPDNHEKMVKIRQAKIDEIANHIPEQDIEIGPDSGDVLIIGWGSTFGGIKSAVKELLDENFKVSHAHVHYIYPFPRNLGDMLSKFKHVLVPEINNGQLVKILRDKYMVPAIGLNKIKGVPITKNELKAKVKEILA